MELIKFIFSSGWTFLGTVILIVLFFEGVIDIIKQIKNNQ